MQENVDIRRINVINSIKTGGSSDIDARPYLQEIGLEILNNKQPIQFTPNINEHIHRWAPYVQGFSASFVQSILEKYKDCYYNPTILDPFAGCGTVLVQAKLNGYRSFGTELNPLLQFIADTKLNCWDISFDCLLEVYNGLSKDGSSSAPVFLNSYCHFNKGVLRNLEIIKYGIESLEAVNEKQKKVKDLITLAFSSILIDCSNLKRSPCLGYYKNKNVDDTAPFVLMQRKIHQISDDLKIIKDYYKDYADVESKVYLSNAMWFQHSNEFDIIITSPPYMNGLDYVMNYKIEMGWLGFVNNKKELKKIKDEMVVCDNVSKGLIRAFYQTNSVYTNRWIEEIKQNICASIQKRGGYRRKDMPYIVHKYFDDIYNVMRKVIPSLKSNGRFVLVVGDSLIADVYIPTDLLIAKIGIDLGLDVESVEKVRERRSGQIRSYRLRESIITMKKR